MLLASSAVNYLMLGVQGFETLTRIVDDIEGYELEYGDLDDAVAWFERLAGN
jgi:hypothetical protein